MAASSSRLRRSLSPRGRQRQLAGFLAALHREVLRLDSAHEDKHLTLLAEGYSLLGKLRARARPGTWHLAWDESIDELITSVGRYARTGTQWERSSELGGSILLTLPDGRSPIRVCWMRTAHLALADAIVGFEASAPPRFYLRLTALPTGLAATAAPIAQRARTHEASPRWVLAGAHGGSARLLSAELRAVEAAVSAWSALSAAGRECALGLAPEWEGDLPSLLEAAAHVS